MLGGYVVNTYDRKGRLIESFYSALAGVTFENRQSLLRNLYAGQQLTLQRRPNNPYDSNAIAVYDPRSMQQVGFIRKYVAANLAPIMDRDDREVCCTVSEITGGGDRFTGVNILIKIYDRKNDVTKNSEKDVETNDNPFKVRMMYLSSNKEGTWQFSSNPKTDDPVDGFCFNSLEDVINSDFDNQSINIVAHNKNACYPNKSETKYSPMDNEHDFYDYGGDDDDSDYSELEISFKGTGAPFL